MGVEEDKKATALVLDVLTDKSLHKPNFTINKRKISPSLYKKVAQAIKDGKITVIYATGLVGGAIALYLNEVKIDADNEIYDILALGFYEYEATNQKMLEKSQAIIHECTHAGFDLLKIEKMSVLEHEAASYVAGSIFLIERMSAMKGDPKKVDTKAWDPIPKAAWDIAILEVDKKTVAKNLYNALDVAIGQNSLYKDRASTIAINDGVGRKWKLKPKK